MEDFAVWKGTVLTYCLDLRLSEAVTCIERPAPRPLPTSSPPPTRLTSSQNAVLLHQPSQMLSYFLFLQRWEGVGWRRVWVGGGCSLCT